MRTTVGQLRMLVKEVLTEMNGPRGGLRPVRGGSGRQYKLGKIEDENKELSTAEAESMFPDSTEAWAEIVPSTFPDFPYDFDARTIKHKTAWFKVGGELHAAFKDMPQVELMKWDPQRLDWFPLDDPAASR